ncbi:ChaC-like protein [Fomitiporia mediterranea MF3/22]|uniref:ChaC-like protein n=1 Tax=Fomitiporia mediterranea (strain MF3/22) TaxID=694068 RepID=UPI0004408669|nr:ChaC-like protein [Fomitiporia mediterranea MF3/22]EJD04534.1 ChaC-like protein [Fomitiporia mediterranea MF3/22]
MASAAEKSPYVVFGYGSLIWKPPPHTIKQTPGYLKGYVRRFAQKSHDHRGTPENPGRVVTLIHKEDWDKFSASDAFPEEDTVWGIAYTIDPEHDEVVRQYLDYREKDGYTIENVDVYGIADGHEKVVLSGVSFSYLIEHFLTYVGKPENPSFIGSQPIEDLAQRIFVSVGPSGPNKVYLYELAEAVRKLTAESYDKYLFTLEDRVRELDRELEQQKAIAN